MPHWLDYLYGIVNPKITRLNWIYHVGNNIDKKNFVDFYSKHTGFVIMYNSGNSFMVTDCPEHMRLITEMVIEKKEVVPIDSSFIKVHKQVLENNISKEVPNFGSRPDISLRIMIRSGLKPSDELVERARIYEESKNKPKENYIDEF